MLKLGALAVLALCLVAVHVPAVAQSYGDGFGLGGVLLPTGSPTVLGVSRLGDALGLEVGVGLNIVDYDGYSSTELGLSAALKNFWNTESNIQPFFGGRLHILHRSLDEGDFLADDDETWLGLEAVVGAEYFVARRVSIEGEVGAGMYFGSFQIRTGTRLAAFLYL